MPFPSPPRHPSFTPFTFFSSCILLSPLALPAPFIFTLNLSFSSVILCFHSSHFSPLVHFTFSLSICCTFFLRDPIFSSFAFVPSIYLHNHLILPSHFIFTLMHSVFTLITICTVFLFFLLVFLLRSSAFYLPQEILYFSPYTFSSHPHAFSLSTMCTFHRPRWHYVHLLFSPLTFQFSSLAVCLSFSPVILCFPLHIFMYHLIHISSPHSTNCTFYFHPSSFFSSVMCLSFLPRNPLFSLFTFFSPGTSHVLLQHQLHRLFFPVTLDIPPSLLCLLFPPVKI